MPNPATTISSWSFNDYVTPSREWRDSLIWHEAPRAAIWFTPLDEEGEPIPDEVTPDAPPEDVGERWAEPCRNLQVGDEVRWTSWNGTSDRGTVVSVAGLMNSSELNNIPDWVPRDTRHQSYRVRLREDGPASRIAWFRIQRLETNE